ncbi:sugar ABC transporter permease [Bosea caraganae]|uniref:Sugar ABC transporter permease n=2 Tax=Bosea caraganae TaxID=2763117 RepID=A0A370L8H6_9HYPH|nr:sugar ABC transporter permease [Bosea caraganae]RDJ30581.1 sugar ABC transporter permease [Bosea caraganae]
MWMAAPSLIFVALMVAVPLGYAIWFSLSDFRMGNAVTKFIGLSNYTRMVADPLFWNGLKITVLLYVLAIVLQLVLGLYLGLLMNRVTVLKQLVRTILISPFLMPPVVIGMMWIVILDPSLGAANYLLELMHLPPSDWLASTQLVLPVVALIDTWQWTPFVALLVLGGLQTLPTNVYEAAQIDGVSRGKIFLHITLPLLGPTLVTAAILRSVDLLRFFDLIYITTQGGPGNASRTLNIYSYQRGIEFLDMGYASAMMLTLTTIILGFVFVLTNLKKAVSW